MKKSLKYREIIADARRVVVKLGTRVLVQKNGRPDQPRLRAITGEIAAIRKRGIDVVLVSSGAIGAGMEALGMRERPATLPDQQMAAAVGQSRLMSRYEALFGQRGLRVGQILLTHDDFHHKIRMTNARRTLENLLRNGVIPIVNENDVVASEEIRAVSVLGDNDALAALVVSQVRADLLILLTTVDGLRERGPSGRTRRIRYLETINRRTFEHVTQSAPGLSRGGMETKLKAARRAARSGCAAVIANGRQARVLTRIMDGEDVGTLVVASAV